MAGSSTSIVSAFLLYGQKMHVLSMTLRCFEYEQYMKVSTKGTFVFVVEQFAIFAASKMELDKLSNNTNF